METKEITIGEKKFIVRELLATESDELMDLELEKASDRVRERLKKQTDMTEDDYAKLTEKERDTILKETNLINGWGK